MSPSIASHLKVMKTEGITTIPPQCPWPSDQLRSRYNQQWQLNMGPDVDVVSTRRCTTPYKPKRCSRFGVGLLHDDGYGCDCSRLDAYSDGVDVDTQSTPPFRGRTNAVSKLYALPL